MDETVGQAVSAERGELVTICGIINATGNTVPPIYVFLRFRYKVIFLKGIPNGNIGLFNKFGRELATGTSFSEGLNILKKLQNI